MKKATSKVLIVVLIIIAIIAITGGVFAYLYLGTDVFKTDQELFATYLAQNINEIKEIVNAEKINEIEQMLKQNKNEQNLTISYTGAEDTAASKVITIDTQNDPIDKKYYGNIGLKTENIPNTLNLEYMKEEDLYSLRFTNIVKQFLSVDNYNLKQLAKNVGINEEQTESIPNTIDFEAFSLEKLKLTEEEKNAEINKYVKLLYGNIPSEKYTKTTNAVITFNQNTMNTNAYTLTLSEQEVRELIIKLLQELKQDEIFLNKLETIENMFNGHIEEVMGKTLVDSAIEQIENFIDEITKLSTDTQADNIVITIYTQNKNVVRIKAEQGLNNLTIDTIEEQGEKTVELTNTSLNEYNSQYVKKVILTRQSSSNLRIEYNNIVDGKEQTTYYINVELLENGNNVKLNVQIDNRNSILELNRNINFVDEIEYKVELDSKNNIILNQITPDQIKYVFDALQERLNQQYIVPLQSELSELFSLILGGYSDANSVDNILSLDEYIGETNS